MFESKKWYKEVTILIVIPLIIGSLLTYVIYIGPVAWLMVGLLFIGLAVWRIVKKKSTVKEVIVMKLLHIALGLGFGLLLPFDSWTTLPDNIENTHKRCKKVGEKFSRILGKSRRLWHWYLNSIN